MKFNIHLISRIAGFVILILALASCRHGNNDTGYVYMPDMAYSQPYDTYTENPNMPNGITLQTPVEGTVPRGMIPYQYTKTFDDQQRAGIELINPFEMTEENLSRGKEQYEIFCSMCHGESGGGDGQLYTRKLFPAKPTSLRDAYVQNKPDGEIYHVITLGSLSTLMGAHGSQIKPEDRWKIILYIKHGFQVN